MKLVPLGDKVVLKQLLAEETTKSGIVLPGQAKEKPKKSQKRYRKANQKPALLSRLWMKLSAIAKSIITLWMQMVFTTFTKAKGGRLVIRR